MNPIPIEPPDFQCLQGLVVIVDLENVQEGALGNAIFGDVGLKTKSNSAWSIRRTRRMWS